MIVKYHCLGSSRAITLVLMVVAGVSCGLISSTPPPPPPPAAQIVTPAPIPSPSPAARLVKASWYGPGLAGKPTTSGELYDPNALTAASKTLPLGSVVKVSNPKNGRSVRVRINDRGPFVPGRSLDLSHGAATRLGIVHDGVARVKLETVPVARPAADPDVTTPQTN